MRLLVSLLWMYSAPCMGVSWIARQYRHASRCALENIGFIVITIKNNCNNNNRFYYNHYYYVSLELTYACNVRRSRYHHFTLYNSYKSEG